MTRSFSAPVLTRIGGQLEMRPVTLDPPGPDEVMVRALRMTRTKR